MLQDLLLIPWRRRRKAEGEGVGKRKAFCIARAERDGTRAETRIRLSPKRTSPFKSVGASVQSTTGSRGVRISSSNGSNDDQTTF